MTEATITQYSTRDLHAQIRQNPVDIITDAYKNGENLSAYLERLNPSENGDRTDAFGRQLREAGIVPYSDPVAGYWASEMGDFLQPSNKAARALFTEFFARCWRKVAIARPSNSWMERAVYLSSDGQPGSWEHPYVDAMQARWDEQIAPAIPLSEVIAITTPIDSDLYRAFYLTYDATQLRMFRVGESADIPIAVLSDAEHTINLKKYGRGLRASYEQLRRIRVDKMAMQIGFMAVQSEIDKLAAIIDIIVNGDGNSGTSATSYNLTTLDSDASAGTLTLKGWLVFRKKFANPYMVTSALMQEDISTQLELLNVGSANVMMVQLAANASIFGSIVPINQTATGVRYGWTSDAPANKIVGLDRRRSIEQVVEIGGEVSEMERFILNQTEVLTMTEVNGYAVLDQNAANILVVNA